MARRSAFDIQVDARLVERLADDLAGVDASTIGRATLEAVNRVALRTEVKFRDRITQGINLSDAYLRERMGVRPADNAAAPEAVIYAPFRHTQLGRYDPKQLTRPAQNRKRSKGDKSRGIPAGSRADGVSVEVVRGSRKTISNGFTMPLRNGNGIGVFTRRKGDAKYTTRLGPSVYQLMRVQVDELYEEVGIDLELEVLAEAERVLEKVLT